MYILTIFNRMRNSPSCEQPARLPDEQLLKIHLFSLRRPHSDFPKPSTFSSRLRMLRSKPLALTRLDACLPTPPSRGSVKCRGSSVQCPDSLPYFPQFPPLISAIS